MLNSRVAFSSSLLSFVKVSCFHCWSFSSHCCVVARLWRGMSKSIVAMSWSRFSTMLGKLLRVSVKLIAKVCCASIKAIVQFFLYSDVSSASPPAPLLCLAVFSDLKD